jgi:hypothetical protein
VIDQNHRSSARVAVRSLYSRPIPGPSSWTLQNGFVAISLHLSLCIPDDP